MDKSDKNSAYLYQFGLRDLMVSFVCLLFQWRRNEWGHGGHGPLTFWPKLFLKSFPSFVNTIFYIESDSPGREEHKSA